jgi:hypothetical protein
MCKGSSFLNINFFTLEILFSLKAHETLNTKIPNDKNVIDSPKN